MISHLLPEDEKFRLTCGLVPVKFPPYPAYSEGKFSPGLVRGWLDQAPAFVDLIAESGYSADCKLLGATAIPVPSEEVAAQMGISKQAQVIAINKLFFADETPVIYSYTLLPCQLMQAHSHSLGLTEKGKEALLQATRFGLTPGCPAIIR